MVSRLVTLGIVALFASCSEARDETPPDNLLSLHLGGSYRSLTKDLERIAPEPAPSPRDTPQPKPGPDGLPQPQPDQEIERPPRPQPQPEPEPEPTYRTVQLAEGQTLYGLCQKHLGSGARWKEIARLNGWSERQASRLRADQPVKLPLR